MEGADCIIALPGGMGTWDELWEMVCLKGIGEWPKASTRVLLSLSIAIVYVAFVQRKSRPVVEPLARAAVASGQLAFAPPSPPPISPFVQLTQHHGGRKTWCRFWFGLIAKPQLGPCWLSLSLCAVANVYLFRTAAVDANDCTPRRLYQEMRMQVPGSSTWE